MCKTWSFLGGALLNEHSKILLTLFLLVGPLLCSIFVSSLKGMD